MPTALIVPLPEADPLVGPWRRAYDPAAAQGVGAHITVLYPFLDGSQLDAETMHTLSRLFARFSAFSFALTRSRRLGDILALDPDPAAPFLALSEAVRDRWPDLLPYRGRYGPRPDPHLTVAWSRAALATGAVDLAPVEAALRPGLPISATAVEVVLERFTADQWQVIARFPLAITSPPATRRCS